MFVGVDKSSIVDERAEGYECCSEVVSVSIGEVGDVFHVELIIIWNGDQKKWNVRKSIINLF